jgi:hypothetical protein
MYEFTKIKRYNYSTRYQNIETFVLSTVAFFIPFLLGHQQLLVGSAVNTFLILAGIQLKSWRILPVILLPSLGAVAAGLIFGPLSKFLLIMVPFIWAGNTLLVWSMRQKKNYFFNLGLGIILKVGLLFGISFVFYSFGVLPAIFLTAMGILQVYTALIGGAAAFSYLKITKNYF